MKKKDELKKISESILDRVKREHDEYILQAAIGRVDLDMDNQFLTRWIITKEGMMSSTILQDITGAPVGTAVGHKKILDANFIWRDSKMGDYILTNRIGTVRLPNKTVLKINSLSTYIPDLNNIDARDGKIEAEGLKFTFNQLKEELRELGLLTEEKERIKEDIEDKRPEEVKKLLQQIEKIEEKEKILKEKISKHIILAAELRYQPILDKEQEKIKRSRILDGSLIIDGGPGTGKTTSLIQRITFLTSETILEYKPDLSKPQQNLLFNQSTAWIFFSPSELLREYLKNAMVREGLQADKERVQVWSVYRSQLFKKLRLINPETNRPFTNYNSDKQFFKLNGTKTKKLLSEYSKYNDTFQIEKLKKVLDIQINNFVWKEIGFGIIQSIKQYLFDEKADWIIFYTNLNENYSTASNLLSKEYLASIKDVAAEAQVRIKHDIDLSDYLKGKLEELFKAKKTNQITDEPQEAEAEEDFEEETDEYQSKEFNYDFELNRKLRIWIRKVALMKFDPKTKLTRLERDFYSRTQQYIDNEKFDFIGQRAFFKKYFEKLLKGPEYNTLREIPAIYKLFRNDILRNSNYFTIEGRKIIKEILEPSNKNQPKNRKIHNDEKDFILYIILNTVRQYYYSSRNLFDTSKHPYFQTFREIWKGVVAIDEATDFPPIQLACMSLLAHPDFNCVTLSGDIMQRMTPEGISRWTDYLKLYPKTNISSLKTSYRQTAVLMDIAKTIYEKELGKEANFKSNYKFDPYDPKPLIYQGMEFSDKIDWISERIIEIYQSYQGEIPSIAIFVKNDHVGMLVANALNNSIIQDSDINCKACLGGDILGDAETVRIYDIRFIKGMEFEAVFYLDIDQIGESHSELLDKYLYVGLSRANFYLAITIEGEFPKSISYLENKFYKNQNWKFQ